MVVAHVVVSTHLSNIRCRSFDICHVIREFKFEVQQGFFVISPAEGANRIQGRRLSPEGSQKVVVAAKRKPPMLARRRLAPRRGARECRVTAILPRARFRNSRYFL